MLSIQNGSHLVTKCIFINEYQFRLLHTLFKIVPKVPIDNMKIKNKFKTNRKTMLMDIFFSD